MWTVTWQPGIFFGGYLVFMSVDLFWWVLGGLKWSDSHVVVHFDFGERCDLFRSETKADVA